MRRIFGDRARINLSSSEFERFIENGNLYVDKTRFIEHVLDEASSVLLITRPRRNGKSLNLDMLRMFLDCKQDTRELFKGLYIEGSHAFGRINSAPAIYLSFKDLGRADYDEVLREIIRKNARKYLRNDQVGESLQPYLSGTTKASPRALYSLIEDIHEAYGIRPYVLIDEYDKLLMDNISSSEYETIKEWLKSVFEIALKDNHHLEKGIIVGVSRISQESLLSGLNNLDVYDVFRPSAFDGDFSLTEEEACELLDHEQLDAAREWYNNYRVGSLKLYTMYSVLSYVKNGTLDNYWGMSGSMEMLAYALNAERVYAITDLLSDGKEIETVIERRLSLRQLKFNEISDGAFYSFAVQAGYLTYELHSKSDIADIYRLKVPNKELARVWEEFILTKVVREKHRDLRDIFKRISDTEEFSSNFRDFVSFQLSSYDMGVELEKTYHVLVFGLILGAGYKCSSNRESGYGRYDLWLEGPDFNVIIEFKKARSETDDLEKLADKAIDQINSRKYYAKFPKTVPLYKVGVGCYRTECFVTTVLHEF
ncbi:MAG: ATP-binding protein [Oscillospiraceae bacterium]|nr:ATP-binding protein [Oscillospiraceae bacterium]